MAFQFGTSWSVLSRMSGPIQGPLLSYETFTAFFLEASFFGILLFGRSRVAVAQFVIKRVGVVGLGHMGRAFAANLVGDGHRVSVYDRDRERSGIAADRR
jgi:cytochrome d ubiquinol oxidase subunit I